MNKSILLVKKINEALSLNLAKMYTKLGKDNFDNLSDEYKTYISKLFKGENRLFIGEYESDSFVNNLEDITPYQEYYSELETALFTLLKNDISDFRLLNEFKERFFNDINRFNKGEVKRLLSSFKNIQEFTQGKLYDAVTNDWYFIKHVLKMNKSFPEDQIKLIRDLLNTIQALYKRFSVKETVYVVLSRHPYDVVGMSTDRAWSSCKNIYTQDGAISYAHLLESEVGLCLIAYAINSTRSLKNKNEILNNPLGRVLIVPTIEEKSLDLKFHVSEVTYPKEAPLSHLRNEVLFYLESKDIPMLKSSEKGIVFSGIYNDTYNHYTDHTIGISDLIISEPDNFIPKLFEIYKRMYPKFMKDFIELAGLFLSKDQIPKALYNMKVKDPQDKIQGNLNNYISEVVNALCDERDFGESLNTSPEDFLKNYSKFFPEQSSQLKNLIDDPNIKDYRMYVSIDRYLKIRLKVETSIENMFDLKHLFKLKYPLISIVKE